MDDFSDDGFDDLNDSILQELENKALQSTQARRLVLTQDAPPVPPSEYDFEEEDDDLDDTVVIDELAQPPRPIEKSLPQLQHPGRPSAPPAKPHHDSGRYGAAQPLRAQAIQVDGQPDIVAALEARMRALETDLFTAKGEAALIRSKFETAQRSHKEDVARLKKQNAEKLAEQERIVQAAVAAEKSTATELAFTKQDLKEEQARARKGRPDPVATTPKKKAGGGGRSNWDIADGFDNVDVLSSPSKGQGRRQKDAGSVAIPIAERTPTKKRKRPAVDSPVMALDTHSDDLELDPGGGRSPPPSVQAVGAAHQPSKALPFDVSFHACPSAYFSLGRTDCIVTSFSDSPWTTAALAADP